MAVFMCEGHGGVLPDDDVPSKGYPSRETAVDMDKASPVGVAVPAAIGGGK